ncbi:class I SAM-dependent methyltransferase [Limisalsivibrio acetivorans]|uniref:class I SAM-dependent methyltransferase n=1 Tax=Limisalsivibrio acetivorans TaxID=1304888 RepID=UPI0003B769B4|nr:methyltransferase domain-containing protein [Limisalsivibrio acetivorans]
MSEFYEMLSKYYDSIFPFSDTTFSFLRKHCPDGGSVLDIGSATGSYVNAFKSYGYDAVGIEPEESLAAGNENVVKGDMRDLPKTFRGRFNLITCIGNTLVHTHSAGEAALALTGFCQSLKPNGKCVVQILNYARILEEGVTELPPIETDQLTFLRSYERTGRYIKFKGRICLGDDVLDSNTFLYPLTAEELRQGALIAGFNRIDFYGDFQGSDFNRSSSFMCVAVLSK